MVRIIVTIADAGMAANVGGPVQITMRTFDIECTEMEKIGNYVFDSLNIVE